MVHRRVALLVLAVVALSGCGTDEPVAGGSPSATPSGTPTASGTPTPGPTGSAGPGGKLTFTRKDGSTFVLSAGAVSCGPSETENRLAIRVGSTQPVGGTESGFLFEAILDDVASGATFKLPHSYVAKDAHGVSLFALDQKTGNELSSSEEESSGTIVVKRAACDPAPAIEVTVDAVLGPELHGLDETVVKGSFALHDR